MSATLTREQIEEIAASLNHPYGIIHLECDGCKVSLAVERSSKTKIEYSIMTYVNGHFKGGWLTDDDAPERKYMRQVSRYVFGTPKKRKQIAKILGKQKANKKITSVTPIWPNGKMALRHLAKVSESISIIDG